MKKYIYAIILLLFIPSLLTLPVYNDGGAYVYMGTLFFDGMLPYVDGWDHKGISLYFINALGYLLGFKSLYGIRLLELILMLLSFTLLYNSLKEKFSKKAAFISVLFGLLTFRYFFDSGNLTEEYAAYFILISISFLLKKKILPIHYMIIGFLFFISFTIRANLIGFWISLFFYLSLQIFQKKSKTFFYQLSYMFLGTMAALVLIGVYFIVTGTFQQFYESAFLYNVSYAKSSFSNILGSTITILRRYELSIILITAFIISSLKIIKGKRGFIECILITWIPLELYLSNMSGKQFAHYYLTWVPIVILSMVLIVNYLKVEIISKEKRLLFIALAMYVFFQIPFFITAIQYKNIIKGKTRVHDKVSEYITKEYNPNQLLIWGNGIPIYALTQKRAPVPYFYQTFLKVESDFSEKASKDFTDKFKKNLPALIVDAKTKSLLFLDKSNKDDISVGLQSYLKEFFIVFEKNYVLKEEKYGMDFYVLKNE